jgi:hypothetical protein
LHIFLAETATAFLALCSTSVLAVSSTIARTTAAGRPHVQHQRSACCVF